MTIEEEALKVKLKKIEYVPWHNMKANMGSCRVA
jgi:hypothetical protein